MLKRYNALWESILVCLDLTMLTVCSLLAYYLAFRQEASFQAVLLQHSYPQFLLAIILIWPIFFRGFRLYHPRRTSSILEEGLDVAKAISAGVLALVLIAFFIPNLQISRAVIIYHWAISFLGLFSERASFRVFLRSVRQRGYNYRRVLIVGAGTLGVRIVRAIYDNPGMGLHVVGFLDDYKPVGEAIEGTFNLGTIRDLTKVVENRNVDRVIVALPIRSHRKLYYIAEKLIEKLVDVSVVPDIYQSITLNAGVSELGGLPLLNLTDSKMHGWHAIAKRVFDIVISLVAILITGPLMVFIAVALKRSSNGSVLFKQWRYGVDGKAIRIYKFRSMVVSEDGSTVSQAKRVDDRITPLGAFLRKTSLDELPQFFNVLQGKMSVVGPRPHAVAHNEQYRRLIKNYMLRHKVKPGITGWAQVNGWRGETDTLEKMEMRVNHDVHYIENWSVWLDIKIVFMTVWSGLRHENAF